jgi:hypothetical protein
MAGLLPSEGKLRGSPASILGARSSAPRDTQKSLDNFPPRNAAFGEKISQKNLTSMIGGDAGRR